MKLLKPDDNHAFSYMLIYVGIIPECYLAVTFVVLKWSMTVALTLDTVIQKIIPYIYLRLLKYSDLVL